MFSESSLSALSKKFKMGSIGIPSKILANLRKNLLRRSSLYWVAVRRTYVFTLQEVEKNLPDIAKSRDTSMNNKKQNSFLF